MLWVGCRGSSYFAANDNVLWAFCFIPKTAKLDLHQFVVEFPTFAAGFRRLFGLLVPGSVWLVG